MNVTTSEAAQCRKNTHYRIILAKSLNSKPMTKQVTTASLIYQYPEFVPCIFESVQVSTKIIHDKKRERFFL